MKKILTLVILGSLFWLTALAQSGVKVSGRVTDGAGKFLESTTVALLRATDSVQVKAIASDKEGRFSFDVNIYGKYLVQVSAVGFQKMYSPSFEISPNQTGVDLKSIQLVPQSKDLKAVSVTANKLFVEQKIDRTVVNVDASVTNAGTNALEVLEKAPGVQIDKDGNISLKGKQGVIIMLDGRPAYLSGPELANMLRGMQSSQLDQIEIMTNPPAKYDAAGNSGIINIKTKKNKVKGFNGNITAGIGQGVYFKTNESLSLNYRNGKVNLFSVYSFSRNNNFQELEIYRRYKNPDGSTNAIFEQTSFNKNKRMNNNLKLGMDYFLTKKTTLGIVMSGFYNPSDNAAENTSYLLDADAQLDSIVYATSTVKELWKNASINLNMRHQFDSTGRELSVDFDGIKYDASNDQHFVNTTFSPNWVKKYDEQLKGDLPVNINIYTAKADYTHPLKKGTRLEVGVKTSFVNTGNKANYFLSAGSEWEPDYGKTNYFDYKENINAAYLSINKELTKKLGVQAGLRYENTNISGFQYGNPTKNDSSFSRSYDSWFPTAYFSLKADKSNQFGLSFGRRIDRPAYQDLNPFLFFLDKYTYAAGNPFMKPQYSNNFELTHIYKGKLTTTLNYGVTKDLFMETFDQEGYATIVRDGNIGKRRNMGIAISLQQPITKWLNTMIYSNYNYSKFSGDVNGEYLNIEAGNLMLNMNNQFRFKNGWSAELSGWYRSKGLEGQIQLDPFGQLAAGVSKQVMKGKGSVRLNVRDIFYTQQPKGKINFESTEARFRNSRDSRVATVTFTYRFGKPINGSTQRKKGSASDEQNRVKTGE